MGFEFSDPTSDVGAQKAPHASRNSSALSACFQKLVSFAIEITLSCFVETQLFYHTVGKKIPKNDFGVFGNSKSYQ